MNLSHCKRQVLLSIKVAFLSLFLTSCAIVKTKAQNIVASAGEMKWLENQFVTAPDTIQTSVYWYWLSDNISKKGVIKDLEAMKKIGINRAFIGNIGMNNVPYGKVKLFSEEWWDIMHTALKTATRLGIEIGIFNSPGWSQSGGPWVKPEQAMRYLTSSEIQVRGPLLIHKKLSRPESDFQDVRLLAYPAPRGFNSDMRKLKLQVSAKPAIENLGNLTDQNEKTIVKFNHEKSIIIDFAINDPYTIRSLIIYPAKMPSRFEADLQVRTGRVYKMVKHFSVDRSNDELNVGFKPYGPVAISIPAVTAKDFRLVFTDIAENSGIAEVKFSSAPVVDSYIEKTLAKMWQTPYPYWSAYQWFTQPVIEDNAYVIDPKKVIDISRYMAADGTLNWKVPAGDWVIERSGMTPTQVHNSPATPEGTGLEADKMSKKHIAAHFDAFLGEIMRRIPPEDRKTWKVAVEDSYETGSQNWSDQLIEKFRLAYGYDPLPYIPVLQGKVVASADRSDRFLWDLRRFVADNLAYEYVAGLRKVSHQHGLTTWLENYGHWGFPGEFLQYGGQSDEVSGEFWSEGNLGAIENRAAASCAHIYGKQKVSAESFTCSGNSYSRYPAMMKQRADRFFTEGINNTLLHVYIQQPYEDKTPGVNAWFGNEFNRKNTWFYDMDLFLKYIKRCNMMLQQGKYVADIAYFISEDAPKMTGTQDPALPAGYSFDYINAEVIKTRMKVKNGRLVLPDGMNYKILVLPKLKTMRPELLLKIRELVSQGAVVLGPKPSGSPSLQNYGKADLLVRQIARDLWGNTDGSAIKVNRFGKGMVIDGMNLEEILKLENIIPDFKTQPIDSILFIHRELKEGSAYFISNQKNKSVEFTSEFRVTGKSPELWDAVTGHIRDLTDYSQTKASTSIPLTLAPYESTFVIFRKKNNTLNRKNPNYPKPFKTIDITGEWQVSFDSKMRGPSKPVTFRQLEDWALNSNDSIRYYSGTAYYTNTFQIADIKGNGSIILDLGSVAAIAKVKINDIEVGGLWTSPYKINITSAVKPGRNKLEVKVVNTWVNRLIGDSKLSENERKTWINYNKYNPDSKLERSGLTGPVKLEIMN